MSPSDPNTPGDSNPATNPGGDAVDIGGRSAAQGRTGTRTFTILVISTVLVVLVLFAAFGFSALTKGATGPNGGGAQAVSKPEQAAVFHASDTPSPKQNPPGPPGGS